jgi:hypothetical protein
VGAARRQRLDRRLGHRSQGETTNDLFAFLTTEGKTAAWPEKEAPAERRLIFRWRRTHSRRRIEARRQGKRRAPGIALLHCGAPKACK